MLDNKSGFTLVEILLVIAIVSIVSAVTIGTYRGLIKKTEVDLTANNIIFDLKRAKANSLGGVDNRSWGVHFVNSSTSSDYYEIFSTPTNFANPSVTIEDASFLPDTVYFTDPSDIAGSKDIIFEKIRGTLSVDGAIGLSSVDNFSRSITVNQIGNIR
jgi:prepilin-type N-terminal cleavage/methylation domain-containing protein